MKTISELRQTNLRTVRNTMQIRYLLEKDIDFDVYLPTKGINLQRPLVWTLDQKQQLIWSILYERDIPVISANVITKGKSLEDTYLIIDGKQRLNAALSFCNNEYPLIVEGKDYLFSELPLEYQRTILSHYFWFNVIYDELSDERKVDWFYFLNFAGTFQDNLHMKALRG